MAESINDLDRLLKERLEQFNVPGPIISELKRDILAYFQRPEKKIHGASVMTLAASVAADKERTEKKGDPNNAKPEII